MAKKSRKRATRKAEFLRADMQKIEDVLEDSQKLRSGENVPEPGLESPLVEQLQHELKAITERLQSANEELDRSKEELCSLHEELTTVNSQLQEKVEELDQANCDISNLMNSADIATLFLDERLCIQRFSPQAAILLNLRYSDIDRSFRDLSPRLDDPMLLDDCNRVLRQASRMEKEVWSIEPADFISSDRNVGQSEPTNDRRCYLRRILPYRSYDQLVDGVVITLLDITSRINFEAESRRLATVVRDSKDAVLVLDLTGRITAWNSGAERMYEYSEAEALKMNIMDLVPEEHQKKTREMLEKIKNGQCVDSFVSQRRKKDGQTLDVFLTVSALTDNQNRPAFVATTAINISSTTTQEKHYRESERLQSVQLYKTSQELNAILEATTDAVITTNKLGIIVRVNTGTVKMFGYSSYEMIGQNVGMLMTSPDQENHDGYLRRYLETGKARVIGIGREIRCQRKDGSVFLGDLSIQQIAHHGLFTGMIRDITERRQLQNQILRAVSDEQRRIGQDLHDTAGQYLAGVGYLIKSQIALLEDTGHRNIATVHQESWLADELGVMRHASQAIHDLQRKIRTVIRGLAPVDVSGNGLMAALSDLTAGIRELHHIRCEFHCVQQVLINDNQVATHLYRIVQEAVNNGLRHGGAGEIFVNLEKNENDIILTVYDDGCGIKIEQSTADGSFGLRIMNYRANLIEAQFSIQPGENGGTIVRCCLSQVESDAK